jgi:formylglycine-generating enzyme required for sulfatase activity
MKRFFPALILLAVAPAQLGGQDGRSVRPFDGGRRFALVIGNDAYPWNPLNHAVSDAKTVAGALRQSGFDADNVTLATNLNLKSMQRTAREFIGKLREGDLAFVYYSGHGVEVGGENFLIPVDFPADANESEVQDEAYSAQQLLRNLERSPARARILVLDACRNNRLRKVRDMGGGLSRMDGKGTLVVFATSAGATAADNGLFATQLSEWLPKPGIAATQLFADMARSVDRNSGRKQTPAIYGLLLEDFSFVAGHPVPTPNVDADLYNSVSDSSDPHLLEEVAGQIRDSQMASALRTRARVLQERLATKSPDVPASPKVGNFKVNPKDGLKYVWIPPGSFNMGCSPGDTDCHSDEKTSHMVTLTKGFYLGQTPVTKSAYKRVTGTDPKYVTGPRGPVVGGWTEADGYCKAIGGRLPTEAEWEYAARAGTTGSRYGDLDKIAWYEANSKGFHDVGQKRANEWGLFDMLGNVAQWVADWYNECYYLTNNNWQDPIGPPEGGGKVVRGFSWVGGPRSMRVSLRNWHPSTESFVFDGFRCAAE